MLMRAYKEQSPHPEELVETHLNLVRKIAWHLHGRVGSRVEIDDLLQLGYLGLLDAAQRYQPQPGVNFAAYAAIRIRGSIIDHLRSASSLCRASMQMQARIRSATRKLEQQLMRAPAPAEVAAELDLPVAEYLDRLAEIESGQSASLDEVYSDHSLLFEDQSPGVEEKLARRDMKNRLRAALERLPEREALVLQLYYVEELNVTEIGKVLGVTTGRVSQIKKAAVGRLRTFIAEMTEEPA